MRQAQHVTLPTIITKPGSYITRSGEIVIVQRLDHGSAYGCYSNGACERWDISGRLLPFSLSGNDITKGE